MSDELYEGSEPEKILTESTISYRLLCKILNLSKFNFNGSLSERIKRFRAKHRVITREDV